jgi:hypothetical protein
MATKDRVYTADMGQPPSEDDMSAAPKPKPAPKPAPAASTPKPKPKPKDKDATPNAVLDDVMARGGRVKKMATGGFVRAADGIAQRGKTKGRMV